MKTINLDPILHAYHLSDAQVTHQTESLHTAYHIQHSSGNHIVKRLTFPPNDTQYQKLTLSCRLMAHLHKIIGLRFIDHLFDESKPLPGNCFAWAFHLFNFSVRY